MVQKILVGIVMLVIVALGIFTIIKVIDSNKQPQNEKFTHTTSQNSGR